jgi:type II secretory pathway pseudopilin PulG
MNGARGTSVVEALVGMVLAGIALAGLAATARVSTQALRLARDGANALAFASRQLEVLRLGPRTTGNDTVTAGDGTTFARTWRATDGRGAPSPLAADVAWGTHACTLDSAVWP